MAFSSSAAVGVERIGVERSCDAASGRRNRGSGEQNMAWEIEVAMVSLDSDGVELRWVEGYDVVWWCVFDCQFSSQLSS